MGLVMFHFSIILTNPQHKVAQSTEILRSELMDSFALSLAFIMRFKGTRKWTIFSLLTVT